MSLTIDYTRKENNRPTDWYEVSCAYCGRIVYSNYSHQKYCSNECREDQKADVQREHKKFHMADDRILPWMLTYDPDPEFPLFNGLRLSKLEIDYMLEMESVAPGTIIVSVKSGKQFEVMKKSHRLILRAKDE